MKCHCDRKCDCFYNSQSNVNDYHYDREYGRNMRRFTINRSDFTNTFRKKNLDNTVTSVVKD